MGLKTSQIASFLDLLVAILKTQFFDIFRFWLDLLRGIAKCSKVFLWYPALKGICRAFKAFWWFYKVISGVLSVFDLVYMCFIHVFCSNLTT